NGSAEVSFYLPEGSNAAALPGDEQQLSVPVRSQHLTGAPPSMPDVTRVVGAAALAQSIREYGHLAARIDPLGAEPPGDPELEAATHGIRDWDLSSLPPSVVGGPAAQAMPSALEAMNVLRRIYCDTTGYDYDHIH